MKNKTKIKSFFGWFTSTHCIHDTEKRIWRATFLVFITVLNFQFSFGEVKQYFAEKAEAKESEIRAEQSFKAFKLSDVWIGTPLEEAADYCHKSAVYFGVDPQITAGIANAESSFRRFPANSYNPFGWGNTNGTNGVMWSSWKEACDSWHLKFRTFYLEQGFTTPEKIAQKYVGVANRRAQWVNNVRMYWNP